MERFDQDPPPPPVAKVLLLIVGGGVLLFVVLPVLAMTLLMMFTPADEEEVPVPPKATPQSVAKSSPTTRPTSPAKTGSNNPGSTPKTVRTLPAKEVPSLVGDPSRSKPQPKSAVDFTSDNPLPALGTLPPNAPKGPFTAATDPHNGSYGVEPVRLTPNLPLTQLTRVEPVPGLLAGPWTVAPDPRPSREGDTLPGNLVLELDRKQRAVLSALPSPFVVVFSLSPRTSAVVDMRTQRPVWVFSTKMTDLDQIDCLTISRDGRRVTWLDYWGYSYVEQPAANELATPKVVPVRVLFPQGFHGNNPLAGFPDDRLLPPSTWFWKEATREFQPPWTTSWDAPRVRIAVSSGGRYVALWNSPTQIDVWEVATGAIQGTLLVPEAQPGKDGPQVFSVTPQLLTFSPDGQSLAATRTCGRNWEVLEWDLTTGEPRGGWSCSAFSVPTGQVLEWHPESGGWRLSHVLIDRKTGRVLGQFPYNPLCLQPRCFVARDQVLLQGGLGSFTSPRLTLQTYGLPADVIPPAWTPDSRE